ncbi:hypothetical protein FDUTEX481_04705 [Tolypothrix sp. PCC 7601]|nr:hypothetical protein FDUTEX481_04705 [Tolypothrix sp. PCC 7601]
MLISIDENSSKNIFFVGVSQCETLEFLQKSVKERKIWYFPFPLSPFPLPLSPFPFPPSPFPIPHLFNPHP